ncbi:MAG: hypothetical protein SGI91_09855 [Alphaproteobacteria bacterium]|nr:hypothetical protein [Alphaproteobacteria bacterium]
MASLTIQDIDPGLMELLQVRAAQYGHSIEAEARIILQTAVAGVTGQALLDLSRRLFSGDQGVDLDLPVRGDDRDPPRFLEKGFRE